MTQPFSLTKSRYDQSTFFGRFCHNLDVVDPRCLLVTAEGLKREQDLLEAYKKAGRVPEGKTDADLWYAKKVRDSMVHPDTGEVIPQPFRMSGFAVYGTPVVLSMLLPVTASSLALTALAQTANQSHNAAVNWCNRSISGGGDPMKDIITGYCGAVSSAVSIGVGANIALNKINVSPGLRNTLKLIVPWPAVCTAGVMNMFLMRRPELTRGVVVRDTETDEPLGSSQAAAGTAIFNTAKVRIGIGSCAVLIPQMLFLMSTPLYKRCPGLSFPTQALYTLFGFGLGVPFSLALSTQEMTVPVTDLEPAFQNKVNSKGNPIKFVTFNKGL